MTTRCLLVAMAVSVWASVVLVFAGCEGPEDLTGVGSLAGHSEAVTEWQNVVDVSAVGNDLTKTDASIEWSAGASSVPQVFAGGYVEFTTAEATTVKIAGLSHGDAGQGYVEIDYALRLSAHGRASVYENGTFRAEVGSYAAGDVFRIEGDATGVHVRHNGGLVYTSKIAPTFPLLVDTSFLTPGATISDVVLASYGATWQNVVGVDALPGDLTKTDSMEKWTAGASSVETLAAAGRVEFTTQESNTAKMIGLSHGDSGRGYRDIDFAIFMSAAGRIRVFENGVDRGVFGRYSAGDVFRVAVFADVVTYAKNGSTFYTSAVSPTYPLGVDASLRTPGATIRNVALRRNELEFTDYIKASNTGSNDQFGASIAMSGETLVIAAPSESGGATGINGDQLDDSMPGAGAVYVFVRSGETWVQQAYIKASNTGAGDVFGWPVAIDGDTLVVGAAGEASSSVGVNGDQDDDSAPQAGAVYVFVRSGTTWSQQAYLKASNTDAGDYFGHGLALSGDTLVVGAHGEGSSAAGVGGDQDDNSMPFSGAAYVFTRSGTTWTQEAYLKASDPQPSGIFGLSVAIAGDTVAVGASSTNSRTGSAYVFTRDGSTWTQQARLEASNAAPNSQFGWDVALDGDTLAVGALAEDSVLLNNGAAYVFTRSGTTWTEQAHLVAADPDSVSNFGRDVFLSGGRLVVGAMTDDHGVTPGSTLEYSGTAYVFDRTGTTWTETKALKAPNAEPYDYFGEGVCTSGELVVVGAQTEDSAATGINGDLSDNSLESAGAVYVFR